MLFFNLYLFIVIFDNSEYWEYSMYVNYVLLLLNIV